MSLQHYLGLALGLFALEMAGIVNYYHQYNTQGVSGTREFIRSSGS